MHHDITPLPQVTESDAAFEDVQAWPDARVDGEVTLYRLYDVGYELRLEQVSESFASSAPERQRPVRGEGQAIQIANPPVTLGLGSDAWELAGQPRDVELSARLFDFGVVSLRARLVFPPGMRWSDFACLGATIGSERVWERFDPVRARLTERLGPSIERPHEVPVTEEYMVFRVHRLRGENGEPLPTKALDEENVARLLVGELRPLSPAARKDLLSPRFSYFEDDVTVLTWNGALVVEPAADDTDVQYVLEFANAQLLELRYYDAILDKELPRIYDEMAAARGGFHLLGRRYGRLLSVLQTRVTDATEAVERVENALKVTDDVFLARIYAAALELFRVRTWRAGIDRKVAILRSSYEMLNAESLARRTEVLEIVVIVLIALEIVLALRGG